MLAPQVGLGQAEPSFKRTGDVVYGRKQGMALTMDVFTPAENANGTAVIWVVSGEAPDPRAAQLRDDAPVEQRFPTRVVHHCEPSHRQGSPGNTPLVTMTLNAANVWRLTGAPRETPT